MNRTTTEILDKHYTLWNLKNRLCRKKNERTLRFTIAKIETIFENMYILGKDF